MCFSFCNADSPSQSKLQQIYFAIWKKKSWTLDKDIFRSNLVNGALCTKIWLFSSLIYSYCFDLGSHLFWDKVSVFKSLTPLGIFILLKVYFGRSKYCILFAWLISSLSGLKFSKLTFGIEVKSIKTISCFQLKCHNQVFRDFYSHVFFHKYFSHFVQVALKY